MTQFDIVYELKKLWYLSESDALISRLVTSQAAKRKVAAITKKNIL